jgi:hypothetical protein
MHRRLGPDDLGESGVHRDQRVVGAGADDTHVTALLTQHRNQLESLTQALLHAETLDAPEAYLAAQVGRGSADLAVLARA